MDTQDEELDGKKEYNIERPPNPQRLKFGLLFGSIAETVWLHWPATMVSFRVLASNFEKQAKGKRRKERVAIANTQMSGSSINSVFYAETYHPIQAGSIDGTDTAPHDNGVYRALLCSSAGLYDPFGDPKAIGDPYCTVFVGRLSHLTTEDTLRKAMSKYGKVKNLRLVRHIVTGASRGYAFVEFETEREMQRAYMDAHHSYIDDSEIIVDYNRQQLMPGWIPRRLGGGLGGRKESGQLRFGGRERPFRAPLYGDALRGMACQTIPYDDLKRLGIPPPPEGRYMSRYEVPSPPRRKWSSRDREESSCRRSSIDKEEHRHRSRSVEVEESYNKRSYKDKEERYGERHFVEKEERHYKGSSMDRSEHSRRRISPERSGYHHKRSYLDGEDHYDDRSPVDMEEPSRKKLREREERTHKRSSRDREEGSCKRHKHGGSSDKRRNEEV
ncbi:unnamed protein product [Dovyalis caffra]|uniref:RRM domain-containing protein n=1 Tax=Dovyalis caffra TaxID=77055 RepID=A0AAV1QNS2_9ROSI|nr:unnamed protein product [Dovyalis caffra]